MLTTWFDDGGPVMYVVFLAWIIVLAAVLDRLFYAVGRALRRPMQRVKELADGGQHYEAWRLLEVERRRAARGVARIDGVSQIATSLGLFGTVLGLARTFFARGNELGIAAPEVLASGLATALYTTVAGLVVFLFGQAFLVGWREWVSLCEGDVADRVKEFA